MTLKKVAIGQAGGPTAVINASLAGAVEALCKERRVYGIMNGLQGLTENRIFEFGNTQLSKLSELKNVPGAALGSGRWSMTEKLVERCVENLKLNEIHELIMIGGNGTMMACTKLAAAARRMNYELRVIGVPKTVDNDIPQTDHSPGFGSAARYVALSIRDIGLDLYSMRNFEQVRIIETMGRNAGWLAAASSLLKAADHHPPHLIYVPEQHFSLDSFLYDVKDMVNEFGCAVAVVSEGIKDANGRALAELKLHDGQERQVLGGAGKYLAGYVSGQLGLASRSEMLGMNQRCFSLCVSLQDRLEAEALGRKAAEFMLEEQAAGIMLTLERADVDAFGSTYGFSIGQCKLEKAATGERTMPLHFLPPVPRIAASNMAAYREWLSPLTGDDLAVYPNALF